MGISSTLVTDADFFLRKVTDADDIATDAHDNLLPLYRPTFIYMHCEETYRLQPFTIELEHQILPSRRRLGIGAPTHELSSTSFWSAGECLRLA